MVPRSVFYSIAACLIIVIGNCINIQFFQSVLAGSVLFVIYIGFLGYWAGRILLKGEDFQTLLGAYFVLCFIIVSESFLLLANYFLSYYIVIPFIALPLFLSLWKLRYAKAIIHLNVPTSNEKQFPSIKRFSFNIVILLLLIFSLAGSLYTLILSRTEAAIFSVLDVVPAYFWIFLFSAIVLVIIECVFSFSYSPKRRWLIIPVFVIAFIIFGAYFLVCVHGWDADPYGWITGIKLVFERGYKGAPGQIMISERGTEAIIASISKLSGPVFDINNCKMLFDLINPLLAAIFIPLFIYMFLRKMNKNANVLLCIIGALSFTLFPTFFDFAITNSNYLGGIFLFGTLFFSFMWVAAEKSPKHIIVLLGISFLATAVIHLIAGIYAIMAMMLAIVVKKFDQRDSNLKEEGKGESKLKISISIFLAFLAISIIPLISLLIGNNIIGFFSKVSVEPMATLKSSLSANDFLQFIAPAWLQIPVTASHIIGEGYNYVRLLILAVGTYQVLRVSAPKKPQLWISLTAGSYFVAYFSIVTFLDRLDLDPYRFAFILDLMLLPIAAILISDLFRAIYLRVLNKSENLREQIT